MTDILYDKQDNVNYRMFLNIIMALYSIYYDGVESTAQYSLLNTHEYF